MKTTEFLDKVQDAKVVEAIQSAEEKTSGEIRVFVSRKAVTTPVLAAQQQFLAMGMHKTRERNAVLIFVAPRVQQFAVVGDIAVHERCGQDFWNAVAAEMAERFKDGDFTGGIVHAVGQAGALLAQHFPHRPDDRNELPDQVERD